jgi:hypothetical protein
MNNPLVYCVLAALCFGGWPILARVSALPPPWIAATVAIANPARDIPRAPQQISWSSHPDADRNYNRPYLRGSQRPRRSRLQRTHWMEGTGWGNIEADCCYGGNDAAHHRSRCAVRLWRTIHHSQAPWFRDRRGCDLATQLRGVGTTVVYAPRSIRIEPRGVFLSPKIYSNILKNTGIDLHLLHMGTSEENIYKVCTGLYTH